MQLLVAFIIWDLDGSTLGDMKFFLKKYYV